MSSDLKSGIFSDFLGYLAENGGDDISHITTIAPLPDADVYHFHRPQLEDRLPANSVVTVHHDLAESDPWLDFSRFSQPYKDAGRIVCLNSQQYRWLTMRGYERLEIIPHGYNARFLHPIKRGSRPKIILGLASRRYGRRVKGEALLFEIAKRLPPDKFGFLLVGPGRTQEAHFLLNFGFETRVFEHLPYRLFQRFYQEIDALLILSWYEGGPACIPEAIATATPIISTSVGMAPDYLKQGTNGILLKRNPDVDAEQIRTLADDPAFHEVLNKGAHDLSNTAISWMEVSMRYHRIYREVCSK
ncbi:glycosyltransferase family 4 protein [Rhizobium sp. YS-1r]|uniref:glycosyltransferase family 4 protein n=1 Tax=Rhizobium sp. YS-1r TaxID=1532558 RepID=UPI001AEBDE8C|nr:glycosyltransferase family 4 protein [Rhizobium sp. YS-1r]